MVNQKQAKRKRDIKSKLMAAICMLLVSSIMMVSSTYAWFTLSTAPEVTGINTAVGANGNLEIALMPTDGIAKGSAESFGITSSAGDSSEDWSVKNITWGNLVDVSNKAYGLQEITLFPSALNATLDAANNPTDIGELILKTPSYGADGRVDALTANTVTSTYDSTEENFPQNAYYGVRAVGTASGMTDRQLAYRNARSNASTAMAQAKNAASQSLNTNGSALADIALAHGVNASATHTGADVTALKAIVSDLLGDGADKTGVLEYIEDAYLNYILAYGASEDSGLTDDQFKVFQSKVSGADDVYDVLVDLGAAATEIGKTVSFPTELTDPLGKLEETRENVESAQTDLNGITATENIPWSTISVPLYKLADTDAMEINGFAASTVKANMSAIVNSVASQGLNVTIATGGGVYADIADHCGDFNASIVIQKVEYNGLALENMNARMQTATTVKPVYLSALAAAVTEAGAPSSAGGQVMPISDMYGYIIDLAFRTNAAESNLLLQADAIDRIYGAQGTDETMGHGSTMTFTSTTTDFTLDQMKELMKAIRIVFFDPTSETREVYATAKLDLGKDAEGKDKFTTTGGNSITAKMYLYELTKAGTTTEYVEALYITDGAGGYKLAGENETATHAKIGDEYKLATHVVDDAEAGTYKEAATGATHYANVITTVDGENVLTNNVITALTQNTATAVSVLVYLDGEYVGNDDVAATAATSMTGTMNLQFASSAPLDPMDYTALMPQSGGNNNGDSEGNGASQTAEITP